MLVTPLHSNHPIKFRRIRWTVTEYSRAMNLIKEQIVQPCLSPSRCLPPCMRPFSELIDCISYTVHPGVHKLGITQLRREQQRDKSTHWRRVARWLTWRIWVLVFRAVKMSYIDKFAWLLRFLRLAPDRQSILPSLWRHGGSNGTTQWDKVLRTDQLLAPPTDWHWDDPQGISSSFRTWT